MSVPRRLPCREQPSADLLPILTKDENEGSPSWEVLSGFHDLKLLCWLRRGLPEVRCSGRLRRPPSVPRAHKQSLSSCSQASLSRYGQPLIPRSGRLRLVMAILLHHVHEGECFEGVGKR